MDQIFKLGKGLIKGGGGHGNYNNNYPPANDYYNQPYGGGAGYNQGQGGYGQPYNQPYGSDPNYNYGAGGGYNNQAPMGGGAYGAGYGHHQGGHLGNHHGGGLGPMSILKAFDKDGDGMITQNDFVIAARQMGLGHVGEMVMKQVFRSFDKNHNGRLEMHEALGAINILKSKHGGGGHGSGFGF